MANFFKDKNGYPRWIDSRKLVHRTMAAIKVGGRIFPGMVVHHVDGNKMNFRKYNLQILSRSAHALLHSKQRSKASVEMKPKILGRHFSIFSILLAGLGVVVKIIREQKDHKNENGDKYGISE